MSQQHIVQAPVSIKLTMSLSLCITYFYWGSRIELAFSYITLSHDPLHSLSGRARI